MTLWDDFVQNHSRNGTIFHERKFLEYHPAGRFTDASCLLVLAKSTPPIVAGVFPGVLADQSLISHSGSSYGGLIYNKSATTKEVLEMLEHVIAYAQTLKASQLEMRLAENLIFSNPPDQELSYLLWHRGFKLKGRELGSVISLQDEHNSNFAISRYDYAVRKGQKAGLVISNEVPIEEAYPLIVQTLQSRHQKKPTHTLAELVELKRRYPQRIKAWTALDKGRPIAAVVVFEANARCVHDFYIAQDYSANQSQPLFYTFDTLLAHYRANGVKYFNFGISSREQWIKWGILYFKEALGGRAVFRETWVLPSLQEYTAYQESEGQV